MKHAAIFVVMGMTGAAIGQQWLPGWGDPRVGTGGTLNAVAVWDRDGIGPASPTVVIGLSTGFMPGTVDSRLAYWDRGWWPMSTGGTPPLFAVASHSGELYARTGAVTRWGNLPWLGNIARWDGAQWQNASMAATSDHDTLFSYGEQLLGPVGNGWMLAWDGTTWNNYGLTMSQFVNGLTVHEGELLAVGGATLSRRTASGWEAWGPGPAGVANGQAVASCNGKLYVGHPSGLHVWDGSSWSVAPGGSPGQIYEMVVHEGELYCVGVLSLNGVEYQALRYDGQTWRPLGRGLDNVVTDMCLWRGQAVIGGLFSWAGGVQVNGICVRSGNGFAPLGTGLRRNLGMSPASVRAVAEHENDLYVAGDLTSAGGQPATGIARWDGTSWSALGSGLAGTSVSSMLSYNGELVVAGIFTSAGGVPAGGVAAWNGASWRALGAGFTSTLNPRPMVERGGYLYMGVNSSAGASIQRWDGTSWTQVSDVMGSSTVRALIVKDGTIYAGGTFRLGTSSVVTPSIEWADDTRWTAMGPSSGLVINDLIERDGALIGSASSMRGVVKWNGSAWVPETTGVRSAAGCLLSDGEDLLIGGGFTHTYQTLDAASPFDHSAYLAVWVGAACGTSDFDGDGDFGTDADIEAFFACLAGNCCETCWRLGSDFNGDGDYGTDGDIEAFFRVLAGGSC